MALVKMLANVGFNFSRFFAGTFCFIVQERRQ
jgi:hypothetical protein